MSHGYGTAAREILTDVEFSRRPWDVFITANDGSDRVRAAYGIAQATDRLVLCHQEYGPVPRLSASDAPFVCTSANEGIFWREFVRQHGRALKGRRVCVDISGMLRPHIMVLPAILRALGMTQLSVVYSDPLTYHGGGEAKFSTGAVYEVRPVKGFAGSHVPSFESDDVLIIAAGFEDGLIRRTADSKADARKVVLFGLPSLQAHMYQQNRRRTALAIDSLGGVLARDSILFAPANNPFATAQVLHDAVGELEESREGRPLNLYLSPLSTKAQALGFAWYYMCERVRTSTSMIFPFTHTYGAGSSTGIARISQFELDLNRIASPPPL